jgi:hypothetical protein
MAEATSVYRWVFLREGLELRRRVKFAGKKEKMRSGEKEQLLILEFRA